MSNECVMTDEISTGVILNDLPLYTRNLIVDKLEDGIYPFTLEDIYEIMFDNNCTYFYRENADKYKYSTKRFFKFNTYDDMQLCDSEYGIVISLTKTHFTVRKSDIEITDKLNISIVYTKISDKRVLDEQKLAEVE